MLALLRIFGFGFGLIGLGITLKSGVLILLAFAWGLVAPGVYVVWQLFQIGKHERAYWQSLKNDD